MIMETTREQNAEAIIIDIVSQLRAHSAHLARQARYMELEAKAFKRFAGRWKWSDFRDQSRQAWLIKHSLLTRQQADLLDQTPAVDEWDNAEHLSALQNEVDNGL